MPRQKTGRGSRKRKVPYYEGGEKMAEIDTTNKQLVALRGEIVTVLRPATQMTADEAMVHAAWLVSLAEPFASADFKDVLDEVQNT